MPRCLQAPGRRHAHSFHLADFPDEVISRLITMRLRPASGARRPGILGPMDKVPVPVRDLTDSDQNQAVLDVASALVENQAAAGHVAASHGPAVAAEAVAAA